MKLNNHGWGTKELIISAVIIIALLLVCGYYIRRLYEVMEYDRTHPVDSYSTPVSSTNSGNSTSTKTKKEEPTASKPSKIDYDYYISFENKMANSAITYIDDYDIVLEEGSNLINLIDLVDLDYLYILQDKYDDSFCEGYVIAREENGVVVAKPYLKCSNYVTEGY